MLKHCTQILTFSLLLFALIAVSAQENPTLNLLVERDSLTLYVVSGPVWLGDLEFRAVDGRGGIRSVRLMDDFDVLQITGGYAETGSCFVYRLSGATPPLPGTCSQINRVFRRDIARSDVFWYDDVSSRARTVTVFGSGAGLTGEPCPPDIPDCPLVWEVTPAHMPLLTEMPVIPPTATSTPILDPLQAALEVARTPILHNADWTPVTYTFDGVEMVLVPTGCFMMGSEDGEHDEKPVHQQCFNKPFWLDKYEVTNEQFDRFNGLALLPSHWNDDLRPRDTVNWSEASEFCILRDARLPTEAEWEYSARGPDNLQYPWGDTVNLKYVVFGRLESEGTANVGSHPQGASWVGAQDMIGNIYEYVSSIYFPYPFVGTDGREDTSNQALPRVGRGPSWRDTDFSLLRASNRIYGYLDVRDYGTGFRCARYL